MSRNNIKGYQWIKVDTKKCLKCGKCVNFCPRDVLRMDTDKSEIGNEKGYPYMKYRDDCWYCDVCTYICPVSAIWLEEVPYLIK